MRNILIALLMIISSNVYAINNCNPYVKNKHFKEVIQCSISTYEGVKKKNLDQLNQPLTASQQRFPDLYELNNGFTKLQIQLLDYAILHRKQLIEAIDSKQVNDKRASDIYGRMLDNEDTEMNKLAADRDKTMNEYYTYKMKQLDDNERSMHEILSRPSNPPPLDITCKKNYMGDGVRCSQ